MSSRIPSINDLSKYCSYTFQTVFPFIGLSYFARYRNSRQLTIESAPSTEGSNTIVSDAQKREQTNNINRNFLSEMLFQLLQNFGRIQSPEEIENCDPYGLNRNISTPSENGTHANTKAPSKDSIPSTLLLQWQRCFDVSQGRLKHKDAAILAMRTYFTLEDKPITSKIEINSYLSLLDQIEASSMNNNAFSLLNKHTVVVEGLPGTGKSTLINNIKSFLPQIKMLESNENQFSNLFSNLPAPLQIVFQFLKCYQIAMEIMNSSCEVFLVEGYYHKFLVDNISDSLSSENDASTLPSAACSWPYDLPMPELVLFLTTNTTNRLRRTSARDGEPLYLNDSASMVHQRSISRIALKDDKARAIYAAVRGPGTVGIETSGSVDEVVRTVMEALDYFGVYSISRASPPLSSPVGTSTPLKGSKHVEGDSFNTSQMEDDDLAAYSLSPLRDIAISEPMMPEDVITNRRISMGVYGMYTKM